MLKEKILDRVKGLIEFTEIDLSVTDELIKTHIEVIEKLKLLKLAIMIEKSSAKSISVIYDRTGEPVLYLIDADYEKLNRLEKMNLTVKTYKTKKAA